MLFDKIEKAYKNNIYRRADADGAVFYFSCEDFEGLNREAHPFVSSDGHGLSGYFYYYDNFKTGRIVIFEHGMGSGHRGYMKEIEMLARHGYLVFAYDHTGCIESGGETTGGFVQSLKDLNDAVNTIKADARYGGWDISVVGHSWGGFSALNITALHPEISHIVAISGFVSVKRVLKQFFGGVLWLFGRKIYAKEQQTNPKFIGFDAIATLADTKAKVLIMHSRDDKTLSFKQHFGVMKKALGNRENITFAEIDGKNHNPNYTEDAVEYMAAFFAEYQQALKENALADDESKKNFVAKFDWERMTKQDDDVWTLIFAALES